MPDPHDFNSIHNCDFLFTSMRSGTNLTVTTIQLLTSKPVSFFSPREIHRKDLLGINRLNLEEDETKKPFFRTHNPCIGKLSDEDNRLIMVLRNPKEVLLGFLYDKEDKFAEFLEEKGAFKGYLGRLGVFDRWNPENKLLIRYEDLIQKPEEVLPILLDFFDDSHERLADHLENIEDLREKMASSYKRQHVNGGCPLSRTQNVLFHSEQMPIELLKKADEILKRSAPDLWEKYLYVYETLDEE